MPYHILGYTQGTGAPPAGSPSLLRTYEIEVNSQPLVQPLAGSVNLTPAGNYLVSGSCSAFDNGSYRSARYVMHISKTDGSVLGSTVLYIDGQSMNGTHDAYMLPNGNVAIAGLQFIDELSPTGSMSLVNSYDTGYVIYDMIVDGNKMLIASGTGFGGTDKPMIIEYDVTTGISHTGSYDLAYGAGYALSITKNNAGNYVVEHQNAIHAKAISVLDSSNLTTVIGGAAFGPINTYQYVTPGVDASDNIYFPVQGPGNTPGVVSFNSDMSSKLSEARIPTVSYYRTMEVIGSDVYAIGTLAGGAFFAKYNQSLILQDQLRLNYTPSVEAASSTRTAVTADGKLVAAGNLGNSSGLVYMWVTDVPTTTFTSTSFEGIDDNILPIGGLGVNDFTTFTTPTVTTSSLGALSASTVIQLATSITEADA